MLQSQIVNRRGPLIELFYRTKLIAPLLVGGTFLCLIFCWQHSSVRIPSPQYLPVEAKWCLANGLCITLEVADKVQESEVGLMYRSPLPKAHGMLFPFSEPRKAQFWMLNMFSPLDMVFYSEGYVRAIHVNVPVCSAQPCPIYGPSEFVDGVIELRSGEVRRLDIKRGDEINIYYH